MTFSFAPRPVPSLQIAGQDTRFPVGRIFCVGRNYAEHAAEMGSEVPRDAPFYFTKSACHVCEPGDIAFPPATQNLHHEIELVVALGENASIFGYAVGLDMTRRDLQAASKEKRRPWDTGKDFENSAIVSMITPVADYADIADQRIWLDVNGETRQSGTLDQMVWKIAPLMDHLSGLYTLMPGDLIMMGTPAGVGPVQPGDVLSGGVTGLVPLDMRYLSTGS